MAHLNRVIEIVLVEMSSNRAHPIMVLCLLFTNDLYAQPQYPIPNSQLSTVESIAGETIVEIAVYLLKIPSSVRIVIALCSTIALSVFSGRQQD